MDLESGFTLFSPLSLSLAGWDRLINLESGFNFMVKEKGKGEKWGVRIERKFDPERKNFPKGEAYIKFEYEFYLDTYRKGVSFVTNASLQKAIERVVKDKTMVKGSRLGRVDFTVARMPKWVYPQTFTPFGYFKPFKKKGLGSLVEVQVLKDVIKFLGPKRLPLFKFKVGHIGPSVERRKHYLSRGLYLGQLLPLEEYYQIVLKGLREGVKKVNQAKPKRKRKKQPKKPRMRRK